VGQIFCPECWTLTEDDEIEEQVVATDEDDEVQTTKMSRKRKAYTAGFKLEAVKFARQASIHKASDKYSVNRSSIRGWMAQEKKLLSLKYLSNT
jgi:uncharacterized Zn finger protein (UPF0148 family)